ncbi:MAG: glycosyltransferase [Candidatus Yanofskybacteria bacterium]|nr:glycosyltransferase [Candidatus Yanofskybacteria bacterium]
MSTQIVTINLVVYNGEKYIRQCLDAVLAQSYPHELIEINILDNNSTDKTKEIIKSGQWTVDSGQLPKFSLFEQSENLGTWPGQEELLKHGHGKYVVALSVDVILHPDFIKNAIEAMERDSRIGALQAKVYKYDLMRLPVINYQLPITIIDTLGFQIFRSRRLINIGHGETDHGKYDQNVSCYARASQDTAKICYKQIFAVEGAVPVFRRQALEDCRLESQNNKIIDHDYFWYGDDLDLAWRMKLFGWKQVYTPSVIAWHDRKTTKALAGGWYEFIKIRKTVPMFKRRLDWRNTTLTIIKNDFATNLLRDLPYILWRQLRLWTYFLFFEPSMFLEIFNVAKLLPCMLKRRKEIMQKTKILPREFHQWIH